MRKVQNAIVPGPVSQVKPLEGSAYPGSYRLRVGRYRICFIFFPGENVIVFTTAFMKRRPSDYLKAIKRHDKRIHEQE